MIWSGTRVCRYNWHSTGWLAISSAKIQIYISQIKNTEAIFFCQTAPGNCFGLKLARCWLQFKKNEFILSFSIIFGTHSFLVISTRKTNKQADNNKRSNCYEKHPTPSSVRWCPLMTQFHYTPFPLRLKPRTFAIRAIPCSAPAVWNSLPQIVLSSDSVAVFKSRLKTFLFSQAFSSFSAH